MRAHFAELASLRLHWSVLPAGFLPALASNASLAARLSSLSLIQTRCVDEADFKAVARFVALQTLRLVPAVRGEHVVPALLGPLGEQLKLKQLKLRYATVMAVLSLRIL